MKHLKKETEKVRGHLISLSYFCKEINIRFLYFFRTKLK